MKTFAFLSNVFHWSWLRAICCVVALVMFVVSCLFPPYYVTMETVTYTRYFKSLKDVRVNTSWPAGYSFIFTPGGPDEINWKGLASSARMDDERHMTLDFYSWAWDWHRLYLEWLALIAFVLLVLIVPPLPVGRTNAARAASREAGPKKSTTKRRAAPPEPSELTTARKTGLDAQLNKTVEQLKTHSDKTEAEKGQ